MGQRIHQTAIDKIEKRDSERPRALPEIAKALGVSESWLRTGKGPKEPPAELPTEIPLIVPLLSWVSAGEMLSQDIQDVEIGQVMAMGLNPRGDWIALRVQGTSMDRISPPESVVFVDRRDKRLVPNACYVIEDHAGQASYKRYRPGPPARFEPVSTDSQHTPIFFNHEPVIVGRVRRTLLDM
jgi:phage repressor protein C with HTH and peptisase S24 domain